jgi:YVTN family beta-propeller protein
MITIAIRSILFLLVASTLVAQPALDFEFFQENVQPIFLKKREGHARCISCHSHRTPPLAGLTVGASTWDEEQSRQNFEMWKLYVVAGEPTKSRALLHPLRATAGGDSFHAGGKHWETQSDPEWQTFAAWVNGAKYEAPTESEPVTQVARVFQTSAAGDDIHVIDPATNKVVGKIEGIEVPHGITIAPDGKRIYVTNESFTSLDVVDAVTFDVLHHIALSGQPNNVAVTNDGAKVYVAIREAPGAVDVIDTVALANIHSIPIQGDVHNVYVTPDGKYAVAGSIQGKTLSVIDVSSDRVAWSMTLDSGVRPMAFTQNTDGSTHQIVVQLSDFHGMAVIDFATQKEVRRITHPDPPGHEKETDGLQGSPSHGLVITPDGKTLWATSKYYHAVIAYSLPDFEVVKVVDVGLHPDWLAIPPDGKNLYVAVAGDDTTVVVDNATMEVIARIPVGFVPKRVAAGMIATAAGLAAEQESEAPETEQEPDEEEEVD